MLTPESLPSTKTSTGSYPLSVPKGYAQSSGPYQQSDQSVDVRDRNLPHVCGGTYGKARFEIACDVSQKLYTARIGSGFDCHDRSRYPPLTAIRDTLKFDWNYSKVLI